MTIDDVIQYYKSSYQFEKKTGMMHNCFGNWKKKGFIPIKTQMKIQELTNGALRANLEHLGDYYNCSIQN